MHSTNESHRTMLSLLAALPATLALIAPTAPRRQTSLRDYTLDDAPIGGPLEPVANYILVKIDDGIDATKGGVFLPDQAKEKPSGHRRGRGRRQGPPGHGRRRP